MTANASNQAARDTWENKAVGSQRSSAKPCTPEYFDDIRAYRYGYETPWLPRVMKLHEVKGRDVLEIGVGHGIDAAEMVKHGANYTGIDITRNHLDLAKRNLSNNGLTGEFIEGDLLETGLPRKFDVIYSFGVMHHIAHEDAYLRHIRSLLKPGGELRIAVYSKFSFFNIYLVVMHALRARHMELDDWRSMYAEGSEPGNPVTIKIRSRREVEKLLLETGWAVESYTKRGFVQNYIPVLGKRLLKPDGITLNALGSVLGWYHCFVCLPVR